MIVYVWEGDIVDCKWVKVETKGEPPLARIAHTMCYL